MDRPIIVFDVDGTLLDSDEPLIAPFVHLGIDRADITFGHVLADECERLGISVAAYLDAYDVTASQPVPPGSLAVVRNDALISSRTPTPTEAKC